MSLQQAATLWIRLSQLATPENSNNKSKNLCNKSNSKRDNVLTFLAALKECGKKFDLERGTTIHLDVIEAGLHINKYIANALIYMYRKCGCMRSARDIFEKMVHKDVVSWNSLIMGYVENGECVLALDLLNAMDFEPDSFTFVTALKACASIGEKQSDMELCLEKAMYVHKLAREQRLDQHIFVATNLVDIYQKLGCMQYARCVFDSMVQHDCVSWTSLIMGYVENGECSVALELFRRMDCEANPVTLSAILKASAVLYSGKHELLLEIAMAIHRRAFDTDIVVASSLVEIYRKCGVMRLAQAVFDKVLRRDVVLWTSLIIGYVENGEVSLALDLFTSMDCEPNSVTFTVVLKGCGCASALTTGKRIHGEVCKLGLEQQRLVATTLVDFYGKCGGMYTAEYVFNTVNTRDRVLWSSYIAGYSSVGDTYQVLALVRDMQEGGFEIDGVTMLLILTACSHSGMVEEGKKCLETMCRYGISRSMEHYACVVDMFCRGDRLEEALLTIRSMPFEGDSYIWTSLLMACRDSNNLEVGKVAFDALVACNMKSGAAYVLMRDMYKKFGYGTHAVLSD